MDRELELNQMRWNPVDWRRADEFRPARPPPYDLDGDPATFRGIREFRPWTDGRKVHVPFGVTHAFLRERSTTGPLRHTFRSSVAKAERNLYQVRVDSAFHGLSGASLLSSTNDYFLRTPDGWLRVDADDTLLDGYFVVIALERS